MPPSHSQQQKDFYDTSFTKIATPAMAENIRRFYVQKLITLIEQNNLLARGNTALEVGCGEGLVMQQLAKHFSQCHFQGVDISDKNVVKAKARGLDAEVADAGNLNTIKRFDLIYGTAILHHLEDIPKFFTQIHSLLTPQGAILFGAEPEKNEYFYVLYHKIRGSWEIEKGMMNISVQQIRRGLETHYQGVKFYRHGNPFVYWSNTLGRIWNGSGLSRLPFFNDLYMIAKKR